MVRGSRNTKTHTAASIGSPANNFLILLFQKQNSEILLANIKNYMFGKGYESTLVDSESECPNTQVTHHIVMS